MLKTTHNLRMLPMVSMDDIVTLRNMRLIGKIKPGLVNNQVILFTGPTETNGFVLNRDFVAKAQLLAPSTLDTQTLVLLGTNALRTMFKGGVAVVVTDPMYTALELAEYA